MQKLDRLQEQALENGSHDIDTIVEDLGMIFIESAKKSFGTFGIHKNVKTKNNASKKVPKNQKPWFVGECKIARKSFRKTMRKYKNHKSSQNYDAMIEVESKYKNYWIASTNLLLTNLQMNYIIHIKTMLNTLESSKRKSKKQATKHRY